VALGERELGTARLEEAVTACRLALQELTRGRVPLDWAQTQTLLGNALASLGGRHGNTEQLEEAVADYRPALQEQTRERVPLDWAESQMNLGNALSTIGQREVKAERLEEALAAWDIWLTVGEAAWSREFVQEVRSRRDKAQAEIKRRQSR